MTASMVQKNNTSVTKLFSFTRVLRGRGDVFYTHSVR